MSPANRGMTLRQVREAGRFARDKDWFGVFIPSHGVFTFETTIVAECYQPNDALLREGTNAADLGEEPALHSVVTGMERNDDLYWDDDPDIAWYHLPGCDCAFCTKGAAP